MIEKGYYKHYKGDYYYIICDAVMAHEDNTQERYVVYKPVEQDTIFVRHVNNFDGFIDTEDGERLKRFKKVENNIPNIPVSIPYSYHDLYSRHNMTPIVYRTGCIPYYPIMGT